MTDYQKRLAAVLDYSDDAEDCNACFALDDVCPYHRGVGEGIGWMQQHLRRIAEDPERLNLLAGRVAR